MAADAVNLNNLTKHEGKKELIRLSINIVLHKSGFKSAEIWPKIGQFFGFGSTHH